MGIWDNEEVAFEVGDPFDFARFRSTRKVGIQEVRGMFLETNVLENATTIGENKWTEGEFKLFCWLAVVDNKIHEFTEDYSDFFLLFVPPGDVLWHFASI